MFAPPWTLTVAEESVPLPASVPAVTVVGPVKLLLPLR